MVSISTTINDARVAVRTQVIKLCTVDVSRRLGMLSGEAGDIKRHSLFQDFDWVAASHREAPPPITPKMRHTTSNGDGVKEVLKHVARPSELDKLSATEEALFSAY